MALINDITNGSGGSGGGAPIGAAGGDLGGTYPNPTVISITGAAGIVNVAATGNVISWAAATTAPGLAQTIATSGATPANITISPQAPNASSATTASGTPGSCIINYASPVSTGTEAFVTIMRAGSTLMQLGAWTETTSNAAIYGPVTPGNNNYALEMQATATTLNGVNHSWISVGGTTVIHVSVGGPGNVQFFDGQSTQFGGGSGVIGISNATVNPTSNPAGGIILYGDLNNGSLKNRGALGAVTTLGAKGAAGVVSQTQVYDGYWGAATTAASATPLALGAYTTVAATGGFITATIISRATSTGTGIAVGDTSTAVYTLAYKAVGSTVTLSTAGITLLTGTNVTTAAAMTAPVLTTSVSGLVITFKVTNQGLATTDSQLLLQVVQC